MDHSEETPASDFQKRLTERIAVAGIVLSFIGSWLIFAGIIAGMALNQGLCLCGFLVSGLGGSLFIKACFLCEKIPDAFGARLRYWLKLGLVMILSTVATPFVATLAFSFGALFTLTAVPWLIILRIKRTLGYDSDNRDESLRARTRGLAMIISSRTPEGTPNECPVCQKTLCIEPSSPVGDAPCPHCGSLLWFVNLGSAIRVFSHEDIPADKRKLIEMLGSLRSSDDSLDRVELVMELEEEFSITIPEDELEKMKTIDDVIDFILYKLPE